MSATPSTTTSRSFRRSTEGHCQVIVAPGRSVGGELVCEPLEDIAQQESPLISPGEGRGLDLGCQGRAGEPGGFHTGPDQPVPAQTQPVVRVPDCAGAFGT